MAAKKDPFLELSRKYADGVVKIQKESDPFLELSRKYAQPKKTRETQDAALREPQPETPVLAAQAVSPTQKYDWSKGFTTQRERELLQRSDEAGEAYRTLLGKMTLKDWFGSTEQEEQLRRAKEEAAQANQALLDYGYQTLKDEADRKVDPAFNETYQAWQEEQKPIPEDTLGMQMMGYSAQLREKALDGLSDGQRYWAEIGLGILENAALLPTAAVNPAMPAVLTSMRTSAQKTYELSRQGIPADEATLRGLISGAIEFATEKLPVGSVLGIIDSATGGRSAFISSTLKQMGIEAGREATAYVAQYIADEAYRDPNASFSLAELFDRAVASAVEEGFLQAASLRTPWGAALSR